MFAKFYYIFLFLCFSFFVQYIADMLGILRCFYSKYIAKVPSNKMKPPPPNFFDSSKGSCPGHDYNAFLKQTYVLACRASLLIELGNNSVQRSPVNGDFFL